jgi:hypothetical protein
MSKTPRCDKLKSRLPIYNDHGAFKVSTDSAEHWEKLARELERDLQRRITVGWQILEALRRRENGEAEAQSYAHLHDAWHAAGRD